MKIVKHQGGGHGLLLGLKKFEWRTLDTRKLLLGLKIFVWQTKLLLGLKIILSGYTINLLKGLKIGERGHGRRLKKLLLGLKIFWRRTPKKNFYWG